MAELSIGAAVGSGFELIRHRPLPVLAWGLVEAAFAVSVFALMAPTYAGMFAQMLAAARSGVEATPDLGHAMQAQGASMLFSLASYFFGAILYCAVFRAVLRPGDGRLAYLRLGSAELFLFLLSVGAYIAFIVVVVIAAVLGGLIVGLLAVSHAGAAAVLVAITFGAALVFAVVYVALRFSLVGPMMVEDGRFHLAESWALTRGKTGGLFLIALSLAGILIAGEIVLGAVLMAVGTGLLGAAAGGLENLPTFFERPPGAIVSAFAPLLALMVLVGIPLSGAILAIVAAPWARAYRDLAGPSAAAAAL